MGCCKLPVTEDTTPTPPPVLPETWYVEGDMRCINHYSPVDLTFSDTTSICDTIFDNRRLIYVMDTVNDFQCTIMWKDLWGNGIIEPNALFKGELVHIVLTESYDWQLNAVKDTFQFNYYIKKLNQ